MNPHRKGTIAHLEHAIREECRKCVPAGVWYDVKITERFGPGAVTVEVEVQHPRPWQWTPALPFVALALAAALLWWGLR